LPERLLRHANAFLRKRQFCAVRAKRTRTHRTILAAALKKAGEGTTSGRDTFMSSEVSISDFEVEHEVGRGPNSVVSAAVWRAPPAYIAKTFPEAQQPGGGLRVALKQVAKGELSETQLDALHREVQLLGELSARTMNRMEGAIGTPEFSRVCRQMCAFEDDPYVYSVLEWCPGGDLFEVLAALPPGTGLPERVVQRVLWYMGGTVAELHAHGIVHREYVF
jgi:serine/threonine protein kinase